MIWRSGVHENLARNIMNFLPASHWPSAIAKRRSLRKRLSWADPFSHEGLARKTIGGFFPKMSHFSILRVVSFVEILDLFPAYGGHFEAAARGGNGGR
jgi:hypothetical protein